MPAEVTKIRADVDATPETILGMLNGYDKRIKHIAAVVISELAWALVLFQKELFEEL
jgi:hypothetical protein